MGIARSTFYDKPAPQDDTAIVEVISGICEEFEFYGWRRVRAELRHRGLIVNHKSATTSFSACASGRRSFTSSEVAARAVSPASRLLPASRNSFDQP